jgi:hypothetical protein
MLRKLLWVAMMTVTAAAVAFGWRERARAAALAESLRRATEAQRAAADCPRASFGTWERALSTAWSANRAAPAKPAAPLKGRPKESFDDLSADEQTKLFDATDRIKVDAKKKLDDLGSKLHLSSEQQRRLQDGIDEMNVRIARSLDALIALATQKDATPTRPVIDALVDGLNAIREAEKTASAHGSMTISGASCRRRAWISPARSTRRSC